MSRGVYVAASGRDAAGLHDEYLVGQSPGCGGRWGRRMRGAAAVGPAGAPVGWVLRQTMCCCGDVRDPLGHRERCSGSGGE